MSFLVEYKKNLNNKLKEIHKEIHIGIFILSIVFGISSWVVFSGIWVEAPLLTQKLPEKWKIPSMIGAVSQLAQIGPILLFFLKCKCVSCFGHRKFATNLRKYQVSDRIIIYFLFLIGLIAGSTIALFWDKTAYVFGQQRSVAFFTCVFCLAILDCTCTIVFLTYIGNFKGNYITGLYIGEGISSLLPSLFALMQGIGENDPSLEQSDCLNSTKIYSNSTQDSNAKILRQPRFSISVYFWLLFSTLAISFFAFLILEFWPSFRKEMVNNERYLNKSYKKYEKEFDDFDENVVVNENLLNNLQLQQKNKEKRSARNLDELILLIAISMVSFVLYGFLPGLSSYSALPYGTEIMHLCTTLSLITQPISSLFATFYKIRSTRKILSLLFISIVISSYIFIASLMSPCPPFKTLIFGGYLMVAIWIVSFSLLMYLRCCITMALKKKHGEGSLIWCGLLTQLGQFVGSITLYILVEFFSVFNEENPCSNLTCSN